MDFHIKSTVIDSDGLRRTLQRLSHEILEWNGGVERLVIVGLQTRGVFLADRISAVITELEGQAPEQGVLDITLYRDDFRARLKQPQVRATHIPGNIYDKRIVLVDDVLYTGRTVRAALDAIMDLGRPACVRLAVLVDRGHRELPIKADFVGKNVPTSSGEEVRVRMRESDGEDAVYLVEMEQDGAER